MGMRLIGWLFAVLLLVPALGIGQPGTLARTDASLPGTWVARGPNGWTLGNLTIDPSNSAALYATSPVGLFGSLDAGRSWSLLYPTTASPNDRLSEAFAIDSRDGRHLLLGTADGLVTSFDRGASWSRLAIPPFGVSRSSPVILLVSVDPFDSSTLYATGYVKPITGCCLVYHDLFKGIDGGRNWTLILKAAWGIPDIVFNQSPPGRILAAAGGALDSSGAPIQATSGVVSSIDGGATWSNSLAAVAAFFSAGSLVADLSDSRILYTDPLNYTSAKCGVYTSIDTGRTWRALPEIPCSGLIAGWSEVFANTSTGVLRGRQNFLGWESFLPEGYAILAVDPRSADLIYAHRGSALLKSTDGGRSFIDVTDGLQATVDVWQVVAAPRAPNVIYAGGTAEFLVSRDSGETWARNGFPTAQQIQDVSVDPASMRERRGRSPLCRVRRFWLLIQAGRGAST